MKKKIEEKKIKVLLDEDLWTKIEIYRLQNRLSSINEAIKRRWSR